MNRKEYDRTWQAIYDALVKLPGASAYSGDQRGEAVSLELDAAIDPSNWGQIPFPTELAEWALDGLELEDPEACPPADSLPARKGKIMNKQTATSLKTVVSVETETIGKKQWYYLRASGSLIGRYENQAACYATLAHFLVMQAHLGLVDQTS